MMPKHYVENKLKPPKAFFDWCYSQIPVYEWSNKQQTILSSDRKGSYVIKKRLTKRSNLNFFAGQFHFAIVLVTAKRIEIQSYSFMSQITKGVQRVYEDLVNLEVFANDKHIKITEGMGYQYVFGLSKKHGMGAYSYTHFYPNNWEQRVASVSELRYLEIDDIDYWEIENIYRYRKEIEFLQKINAKALANEIMHPKFSYSSFKVRKTTDMRVINQNWLRKNKPFFKNSNRTFLEFELEKRIKARGGKVVSGIEKYLDYRDIDKIPKGVGLVRFQNWVIKNEIDFHYYQDYLGLLDDLKVPIDSENLIIPKDLTKAHDNAVKLLNQLKREEVAKEFERTLKSRKNLEMCIDGYRFILPKSPQELIAEGKALHHCVGSSSYVDNHSKGQTTILFVRQNKDVPLYTMEFRKGRIVQTRGKHNQDPSDEVKQVVDKWLSIVVGKNKLKQAS